MESINHPALRHVPWNKGKLVGQKAPLKQREIWAIRIRLQLQEDARELALFNLAIDSKLRSCDLVRLRVRDVCQGGRVASRAIVMQRKTKRPVQFEIAEQTRESLSSRILCAERGPDDTSSPAACASPRTCPLANTHESFIGGCRPSGLIQLPMVRTRCGGPRRRSSTAAPRICESSSCCWGTASSRAPSGIAVSTSTMLWRLRNKPRCRVPSRSATEVYGR